MLGLMRRGQRWLLWGVIILVGGVFVLYLGLGGPPPSALGPSTVLDVDGRRYTVRDVLRVRSAQEQRYREALGDDFDSQAAGELLDQLAVSSLEGQAVMAIAAEQVGFRVSDSEVREVVRRIPGALDEKGRLDAERVRDAIVFEYGSERRFVERVRDELLQEKLLRLLDLSVDVSEAEARESLLRRREEVRIAYVALDPSSTPLDLAVPQGEVDRLLADEGRLREFYTANADRYHAPERVRARHILLRLPGDAPPEQDAAVRLRAEEILGRLLAGEDFAALAKELSEDPGTKDQGGDLGFFSRGQMARPFEESAFALEPGAEPELIRTDFGYHLLRVEEKRPAEDRAFEEVRAEIAEELARADLGATRARAIADRLAAAVAAGSSLEEAARAEGLTLERPDWIRRSEAGQIPGLGGAPEVLAAAFALPEEQPSSERIFEVDDRYVLVQRLERRQPDPDEIEPEVAAEQERLRRLRRAQLQDAWITGTRDRLLERGRVVRDLSALSG